MLLASQSAITDERVGARTLPDSEVRSSPPRDELKFAASDGFHQELRRRVEAHFQTTGQAQRDCPQLYLKTALILTWTAALYSRASTFLATTWWQALPLAVSLGLSMAAVGFNIQHDGSHHAFSNRRWVNKLMAMSLDLLGGSSYVWAVKHNVVHQQFLQYHWAR